ncbi:beta-eliminating lyase [Hypoxylon trugodes]|uniref:beta-eliminating lyase n=1 Tax=Hypoxylon trugodes TaxID=326681 RepID=UPI00219CA81D|nr:beta-eliminating lyase [Hypoxylon trugodes]KAI1385611.1 beta-eliminating lyase [Hypoxylon trugodes]
MFSVTSRKTPLPPSHSAVVVRSLLNVTPEEREEILKDVEYNVFAFPAGLITCDYLSDSGASAMTDVQWAALMRGDESYGRNWGYYCLLEAFRDTFERGDNQDRAFQSILTGTADSKFYRSKLLVPYEDGFVNGGSHQLERPNFFIVPQGRCAEALLFSTLGGVLAGESQTKGSNRVIISNGFFDTTGANATVAGFELQTFTQPGLSDPFPQGLIGKSNKFKGNLDITATENFLDENPGRVSLIVMTITNNWAAAQPVSMANIRDASLLAKRNEIPFFFDACRFAENAMFVRDCETGYSDKTIPEIVKEMFSYVDGFTISLKKDGLSNMGGVLCFRDKGLLARKYEGIGLQLKERQILLYRNDSYDAMSGRDLMAAAAGLYEGTKEYYLRNRISQVQSFAQKLLANGISVLSPPGGHAVYLDMDEFFYGCDRKLDGFASVGFTLELIKDYGIRAAEVGPFGWEWDKKSPEERKKIPNLVRFAVPRQVSSDQHIDYTVAAIKELYNRRHTIPNVEISRGKNMRLRHFQCGLKPVPVESGINGTYYSEAKRQISHLSRATGQDETAKEQLLDALRLSMGTWGQYSIPEEPGVSGWLSNVSNDGAPFEYSVQIDQRTGKAQLRFLVEAQPEGNTLTQLRQSTMYLNADVAQHYGTTVSLSRFGLIYDLFIPSNPEGKFVAWHSCALAKGGPDWKIYLNPAASGQDEALSVTRKAFKRLGLESSWDLLERIMTPNDSIRYFSLDLSDDEDARVKVYVAHPDASASEIARKNMTICPDTSSYEIERFFDVMAGGSLGPYNSKSVLSCFAFTSKAPNKPIGTVHFPIVSHVKHDGEVQERVEKYLNAISAPTAYREKYRGIVGAVQRRPLDQGRGIHAWVSLKQDSKGVSNTFYVSPELFGTIKS